MNLKDKNALITGGNRGIGRAISCALALKGAHVAVHYHKEKKKVDRTLQKIEGRGGKAVKVQANVENYSEVQEMMKEVNKNLGSLDVLVNNAGISGPHNTLEDIGIEEWKEVIGVNLTGVFNCCKAAASDLVKNKGKVINISSIAGKMGGTIGCHYAASKAGVIGFTFALARELAPHITVNAVAPGPVDTELISEERKKILSQKTPFGRIAEPEEIAHTVVYLLENDYVSGEVIDVNAGRYMD
ncbi:3-oxoacyl-ACP reductase FabG [bacterium]|nr:3-oxoacyl-ACP reductase FabG [bacterium]